MSKRYTIEELKAIGMNENQIAAIMNIYTDEDKRKSESEKDEKFAVVHHSMQRDAVVTNPVDIGDNVPINCSESMSATTVFDLQRYSKGTLVRFPDFAEGQPFVARVRRTSMLALAKQGMIPNTLLAAANELFSSGGKGMDADNEGMMADIYNIMEIICDASLKEPTYQQIKDAGMELSDNQLMAIFNYTQVGVKALESFR